MIVTALILTCGANTIAVAANSASVSHNNSSENTQKYSRQQNNQQEVALRCGGRRC